MSLRDGNIGGLVVGIVAIVASLGGGGYYYFSHGWMNALWIAVAFLAIGLFSLLGTAATSVIINKPNNKIDYQRKRLIGGSRATYAVSDVLRIETRKQWRMESAAAGSNNSQTQQVLISQSVIVFKNGSEVPLDNQNGGASVGVGGVMMSGSGKETAIAAQVASFISVPFQEVMPPNMGMGGGINIGGMQL